MNMNKNCDIKEETIKEIVPIIILFGINKVLEIEKFIGNIF